MLIFYDIDRIVSITFSSNLCHTKSIVTKTFRLNFSRIFKEKEQ